jgi:hypothetical protein
VEEIIAAARRGDWNTLKGVFEPPKTPILESADDYEALVAEWVELWWPEYEKQGNYTRAEVVGFAHQYDREILVTEIADIKRETEQKAKTLAAERKLMDRVVAGIREATTFSELREAFSKAFEGRSVVYSRMTAEGYAKSRETVAAIKILGETLRNPDANLDEKYDALVDFKRTTAATFSDFVNAGEDGKGGLTDTVDSLLMTYGGQKLADLREKGVAVVSQHRVLFAKAKAAVEELTAAQDKFVARGREIAREMESQRAMAIGTSIERIQERQNEIYSEIGAARQERELKYNALSKDQDYEAQDRVEAEYKELYRKKLQTIADLRNEMAALDSEWRAANAKFWSDKVDREGEDYGQKVKESTAATKLAYDALTASVHAVANVTQEDAEQWFSSMVSFDKSATAALKRKGYSPETVKQTIIDFHRLTGGRLPRVTFTTKRGQRAAAQTTAGVVYVAGDMTRATMFHELAHILEDDDKTRLVATAFRDNRAKGNAQSLRTLTGNKSYDSNERAVPDNFVDPYVGKVYAHGSTEVFSMGLQYLSSPDVLEVLMQKDPDHLNMIIGYLSEKPRLDGQKVEGQKDAHVKKQVKLQSAEDFAKKLDKKIAAAGEFWLKSGITVQAYTPYGRKKPIYRAGRELSTSYSRSEGASYWVKSMKVMKRVLWLHIANGEPEHGPYSLSDLTGYNIPAGGIPDSAIDNAEAILSTTAI